MLAGFFHTLEVRLLATSNSLLIIGLPRSLSTHIYQVCRRVLKKELRHPTSTGGAATSGEILNYVPDWFGSKRLGETRMEFYPDFERILNEHAEGYVQRCWLRRLPSVALQGCQGHATFFRERSMNSVELSRIWPIVLQRGSDLDMML